MEHEEVEILGALNYQIGDVDIIGEEFETDNPDIEILGAFGWVKKAVKKVGKAAKAVGKGAISVGKTIVKSPIVKTAAGGLAIAFPAVGVPLAAGLVVADRAIKTAEGLRGTPKQQAAMKKTIANTVALAQRGNAGARKAVELMATARRVRETQAKQTQVNLKAKTTPLGGLLVVGHGKNVRIERGQFAKV